MLLGKLSFGLLVVSIIEWDISIPFLWMGLTVIVYQSYSVLPVYRMILHSLTNMPVVLSPPTVRISVVIPSLPGDLSFFSECIAVSTSLWSISVIGEMARGLLPTVRCNSSIAISDLSCRMFRCLSKWFCMFLIYYFWHLHFSFWVFDCTESFWWPSLQIMYVFEKASTIAIFKIFHFLHILSVSWFLCFLIELFTNLFIYLHQLFIYQARVRQHRIFSFSSFFTNISYFLKVVLQFVIFVCIQLQALLHPVRPFLYLLYCTSCQHHYSALP